MKKLTLTLLLSSTFLSYAQSLLEYVPASAECVISLDGKRLTSKIGERKIENSEAFLAMTESFLFKGNAEGKISDLGVELKNDFVFFFNADTSMEYMGYLYGVEKRKTFEKYIKENTDEGERRDLKDFSVIFFEGNYDLLAWDKKHALYLNIDYLHDSLRPLDQVNSWDWFYEETFEYAEEVEVTEMTEEEMKEWADKQKAEEEAEERRKAERIAKLREAYIEELKGYFGNRSKENILANEAYTREKDPGADVYLWLSKEKNVRDFDYYTYYYNRRRQFRKFMYSFNNLFGNQIAMNGLFKENQIQVVSDMSFDKEIAQYFKEIYSSQISKDLFRYVNTDKALAVSSFSVKSEKVWKHYPRIYAEMYEKMYSRNEDYSEEVEVLLDFIEIFMDEEALGEIATGDVVFVLKDLVNVEVKYTTYEYNEDYSERKEVEKTRKEIFPEFMAMFTTKNKKFLDKLLNLAVKNEVMYRDNQYYYTDGENRDIPFKIGFTVQDGIAFVGSDLDEIKSIADGKGKDGNSGELTADMTGNQGYMKMDFQALLKKIPTDDMNQREKKAMEYARDNMRSMWSYSNLKDDKLNTQFFMGIPKNAKNGAAYIWDFMEEMYKIDQEGREEMEY
ncbi:MAG: hypothetical protein ACPG21_00145 [Crocinitomicaceae bacterium]